MDHIARLETAGGGDARLTGRATAQPATLGEDLGPSGPMDGAIDAAPSQEAGVGGIHDGLDLLARDVTLHQLQAPAIDREDRIHGSPPQELYY